MRVDYQVQALYEVAIKKVVSDEEQWKSVCRMMGRLYRYEFDNILMVYMQKPDATLVADYDTWKDRRVRRYVKHGSKGIAIFPSKALKPYIRYVFDISDTNGRNTCLTWKLEEPEKESYARYLGMKTNIQKETKETTENFLKELIKQKMESIIEVEFSDKVESMEHLIKSNMEIHKITTQEALRRSILYTVFTRCGFEIPSELQDFSFIKALRSEKEIYRFGALVSDISCETLKTIARELRQMEREAVYGRKNQVLRSGGRNVISEFSTSQGKNIHESIGEIRKTSSGTSKGKPQGTISDVSTIRNVRRNNAERTKRSLSDDGITRKRVSEETSAEKSTIYNGTVADKGTSENAGRRNRDERSRIAVSLEETERKKQLDKEIDRELSELENLDRTKTGSFEQASFSFDSNGKIEFPKYTYIKPKEEQFVPNEYVSEVLLKGSNFSESKKRIYAIFDSISDADERIKALKQEYGQGGSGWPLEGYGLHGYDTFHSKGIHFQWRDEEGEKEGYLNWKAVEKELSVLIMTGEYYQPLKSLEIEKVASDLYQQPLDTFFNDGSSEDIGNMILSEAFKRQLPISDKAELMERIYYGSESRPYVTQTFKNRCGACQIEQNKNGIALEFYDEDNTKWRAELDWQDCVFYVEDMIQEGAYKAKGDYFRLKESLKESTRVTAVRQLIEDTDAFFVQSSKERQEKKVELLQKILKAVGKEKTEVEVIWADWEDMVLGGDAENIWHGKQFYQYMYHEYLQSNNGVANQVLSREEQKQFLHDMAVSRIWEKPLSVPKKSQKTENLSKEKTEVIKSQEQSEKQETKVQREKQKEKQNKKELISQEKAPFVEHSQDFNEKQIKEQEILSGDILDKNGNVITTSSTTFPKEVPVNTDENTKQNFYFSNRLPRGSAKTRYQWNIEAIRLLKEIETANRFATYEEKEILARYVGWGGIPQVFDEKNEQWKNEYAELKSLLSESEYRNARESINTAFYTSPDIIEAIYQGISKLGFKNGTILEPSLGVGHFFGAMPEEMRESKLYGVEKDAISGKIAKLLYPNATIKICGFEETQFSDNFFDIAIGNIPFGAFQVFDKNYAKNHFLIHDCFVAKSLDKVRPGGMVAFITSKGTMDKANPSVRKYFAERAELVGAIRLPNTAFRDSAGTDVTSDILFFQKREKKIVTEPNWIHLGQTEDGIPINSYFVEHPEMMLGKMEYDNRMFGKESRYTTCVNYDTDFDLKQALLQVVSNIQGQITDVMEYAENIEQTKENDILDAEPDIKNYTYTFVNGNLYYRENSKMYSVEVSETIKERIRLMDKIRSATRKLIAIQTEGCTEQKLKQQQNILNNAYDMYYKKYGAITARGSRMAFQEDADYPLLCSLEIPDEDGNVKKADMFYKQTIRPNKHTDHVETASEALHISIREFGFVNIPFMAEIYQPDISRISKNGSLEENITRIDFDYPPYKFLTSQEEIEEKINNLSIEMRGTLEETELKRKQLIAELKGLIFADPEEYHADNPYEGWKTADEYLSGNVRHKLRVAKTYAMQNGELFAGNVHALEQVQPKDLETTEIEVRIGTTWIEVEDYEKFLYELLGTPRRVQAVRNEYQNSGIQVKYNEYTQNWFIENKSLDKSSIAATKTYGTSRINAYSIMEECLNLRTVTIRDRVEDREGNVYYQVNQRETMLAREKQTQMKEAFKSWIFKEPNRRKKDVEYYNNTFNNIRLREYDGSYLTFPGMNPDIHLRKHQKNAIAHILLGGNTLLAHVVGAGKSYTMMAACMEQKRLGLANKTVMVVPKPLIGQTAGEFMRLYPSANILVATERDFEKSRRQQFVSRIATGDYDCIIMSHSQFERIPISSERKERMLSKQIEEMSHAIEELKAQNGERWSVKQIESQKKKLEHQLKVLSDESRKDDLICFEELGVDSIMVDEAHHFKNCAIFSKINNISGISATGSQKATDMQLKCQYLTETYGNRGIVFATGTPVSNSMCELYVMQRYLQKDALERMGIYHFDAWAANFGEVTTALELSVEGSGFRFKSRFNKFTNLPELMTLFKDVADVQTADMLSLPVPSLKGGKYNIVESEPDWYVKQVMEDFVVRAERIRNGTVDPTVDNFLKITSEARLLGTDARLLEANAPENIDGKLNKVIENVTAEYFQNNKNGKIGCQLVFSDIGTPKSTWTKDWEQLFKNGKRQFDVYNYIKTELVKRNIPSEEIAYIHDAKSDVQREELFREMRTGKKKIIIGSTDQCGTGVNVQTHLVALHHTDCPWKPSSIEQREGRGIRQGNENEEVAIYRYVTKGTFDAYMWGIVENKQRFISQVMTSKSVSRNCEDIDEATLSYAEIKAVATGNPLIKEKMQLENEVQRLKLLKNSYDSQKYTLEDNILIRYPKLIAVAEEKIKCVEQDMKKVEANLVAEPDFSITIGNIKYTERVDAGTVFLKAVSDCKISEITPIGICKGFEILAEKNYTGVNCMILRGKSEYKAEISTSPVGNMVKLENLLNNIPQHLEFLKKKLEQYQRDLEQSKLEYQKPFEQEQELKEKMARLDKLNIQLDLENQNLSDEAFEDEKEEKKVAEQYTYKMR